LKILKDILYKTGIVSLEGSGDKIIQSVCFDSAAVNKGSLFVAIKGGKHDGHSYILQAIENGASAIVYQNDTGEKINGITYIRVSDSSYALGIIASNFYDNPSSKLKLVGITGTNGKTTFVTLMYQLFKTLGYKTGLLSTIRILIDNKEIPSTHTTPDAVQINRILNEMVQLGVSHCFMEVSSHAIVQHRIAGLVFTGGVFSNITHDHLDFHNTFSEYIKAKKIFFDLLPAEAFALTNSDDKNGKVMLQNTKAAKKTYSLKMMSDFKCKILENQFEGLQLQIDGNDVWCRLVGEFNAYNLLAVYATAILLGENQAEVLTALSILQPAEGRFDFFKSKEGIIAIIDYAHTPDALQNVLQTINDIREGNGKLITVAGAGGDRDRSKRPIMAAITCNLSNKVILTSDNPRSEDPAEIIREMYMGVDKIHEKNVLSIVDRREAIKTACTLATPGDIILIAGKGHEKYQEIKGVKYHFDDREILKEFLNEEIQL